MRVLRATTRAIALVAALAAAVAPAQVVLDTPAVTLAREDLAKGRYLAAIDALEAAAFNPDGSRKDAVAAAFWRQVAPFITNEADPAAFHRTTKPEVPDTAAAARFSQASPRDAIADIVRRARSTSIVILNEAHYSPRDRAFALDVARALRPLGYSTLAVEGLRNRPAKAEPASATDLLKRDGFARLETGYYVRDPVFAGFLREALRAGYTPVAYEMTAAQDLAGDSIAVREQAQADNLMAAIFRDRPNAKVLIYVGHAHVAETAIEDGRAVASEWMAARLKRMTGINPLTIDQTTVTDLSQPMRAAYAMASAKIGTRPAIFYAGGKPLVVGYEGVVDIQVVHPRRRYRNGRPTWLATLGGQSRTIPPRLVPTRGRRLIQAFARGAPSDAIPLDQIAVTAGRPVPKMMVPKGPIEFRTQP